MKIETLCGKNPTEFTVDRSTVSRWANRFHGGCVSIDNDPRPERPRTLTNERSVKFMADALDQGSSNRGPPAALRRVLCGPGRQFHKIQCVINIEA